MSGPDPGSRYRMETYDELPRPIRELLAEQPIAPDTAIHMLRRAGGNERVAAAMLLDDLMPEYRARPLLPSKRPAPRPGIRRRRP